MGKSDVKGKRKNGKQKFKIHLQIRRMQQGSTLRCKELRIPPGRKSMHRHLHLRRPTECHQLNSHKLRHIQTQGILKFALKSRAELLFCPSYEIKGRFPHIGFIDNILVDDLLFSYGRNWLRHSIFRQALENIGG